MEEAVEVVLVVEAVLRGVGESRTKCLMGLGRLPSFVREFDEDRPRFYKARHLLDEGDRKG